MTSLFTRAATDGSARPDVDPATLATEVAAFLEGAHLLRPLDPDQVDLPAVHRGCFEGLTAHLRP
nr:hypothetical protein [Streptomyces capitiformicae]